MSFQIQKSLILTAYPLSAPFEHAVRGVVGHEVRTITVAQLRAQGFSGLLRQLWAMRGDSIVLPIEEENSSALLPVLKLLAACTRSRSICIVHPDLRCEVVNRWKIALDALGFVRASASCLWSAYRARRELSELLAQPRAECDPFPPNGAVIYLKTNLWFGIKAGGSVGHIAGVANGLQRLGHSVTFASAEPPVMIDDGVKFLPVRPPAAYGLPYELNNYRFQEGFLSTLRSNPALGSAHLVYQRLSAANYLGVVLSRRHHLPLVVEYNGSEVWVAKHWGRGMKFQKLAEIAEEVMLKHAHLVVTVSDVLRDELVTRGVAPERIVTYPNCVDPEVFNPERFSTNDIDELRDGLDVPKNAIVATFVGTFGQWHGAEKLAEAIVLLHREQGQWLDKHRLHFLFVGDGLTRKSVEEIIERAGAMSRCTFVGLVPQEKAPLYLAASDILVSPHVPNADGSRFFGSPTKLFEYMAMGKPILASSLEQITEVFQPCLQANSLPSYTPQYSNKESALLARPGEVSDLVNGLLFLVEQPNWCSALGKNARNLALDKYTWDKHVLAITDRLSSGK